MLDPETQSQNASHGETCFGIHGKTLTTDPCDLSVCRLSLGRLHESCRLIVVFLREIAARASWDTIRHIREIDLHLSLKSFFKRRAPIACRASIAVVAVA